MLVLAFKLLHVERGRKVTCALGAVAMLVWSVGWLCWPMLSFEFDLSAEFFAFWFATSIHPLFIYLIVLAVAKRLVLDADPAIELED